MSDIKHKFAPKDGSPVLPNVRPVLQHAKEYLLKLSKLSEKELQKDFGSAPGTELGALKVLAGGFANSSEDGMLELFDDMLDVSSKMHEGKVYVLPGAKHAGEGFTQLQLGDELQYVDEATGDWKICELIKDSYVDKEGLKLLEILDFSVGIIQIEPWLIRRKVNN